MLFTHKGKTILTATRGTCNVALLDGVTNTPATVLLTMGNNGVTIERWHARFNHGHYGAIQKLEKSDTV